MLIVSAVPMLLVFLCQRDMSHLQELCDRGGNADQVYFAPSLLLVINSLACKNQSNGMKLENAECQALVRKLAKCSLPFQCAHGRPSVVPLAAGETLPNCLGLDWGEVHEEKIGSRDELVVRRRHRGQGNLSSLLYRDHLQVFSAERNVRRPQYTVRYSAAACKPKRDECGTQISLSLFRSQVRCTIYQ